MFSKLFYNKGQAPFIKDMDMNTCFSANRSQPEKICRFKGTCHDPLLSCLNIPEINSPVFAQVKETKLLLTCDLNP